MKIIQVIVIAFFASSCMANPSIEEDDCNNINSSPHLDDCVRKRLVVSNKALENEYLRFERRVENDYSADPDLGKDLISVVKKAHDSWIIFRDSNCRVVAFEVEEGTSAHLTIMNNCTIRMNAERIKELKKLP